jgi:hypothetical protein
LAFASASASEECSKGGRGSDSPSGCSEFVSEIIEGVLRSSAGGGLSFIAVFQTLQANGFRIVSGVDSGDVSAFISRAESAAESDESPAIFRDEL